MVNIVGPDLAQSVIKNHGGVSRLNKYRVILPTLFIGGDAITMDILCRGVNLPGRALTSIPRKVSMKEVQIPTGYTNDPVEMVFTETNDHAAQRYIDIWMGRVVNPNTYEIAFKDNIVRDIVIMSTDDSAIPTYVCVLKNAFPKFKTRIDLADTGENTIMELRVQFEYEDFEVKDSLTRAGLSDIIRNVRSGSFTAPTNLIRNLTSSTGLTDAADRVTNAIGRIL